MMRFRVLVMILLATSMACSSLPPPNIKAVKATVASHEIEPFENTRQALRSSGEGHYFLTFEVVEQTGTSRYRFEVRRGDYIRYQDGDTVELVVVDGYLRDIRPVRE